MFSASMSQSISVQKGNALAGYETGARSGSGRGVSAAPGILGIAREGKSVRDDLCTWICWGRVDVTREATTNRYLRNHAAQKSMQPCFGSE